MVQICDAAHTVEVQVDVEVLGEVEGGVFFDHVGAFFLKVGGLDNCTCLFGGFHGLEDAFDDRRKLFVRHEQLCLLQRLMDYFSLIDFQVNSDLVEVG